MVGPGGRVWTVGRRWVGDRPRVRKTRDSEFGGAGSEWGDLFDFAFDDITPGAILAALTFVIVVAVLVTVVWPLVAIAVEIVLLLIVFAAGVVGRVLFRRPWTVEARAAHLRAEWNVIGWRASGELIEDVSRRIAAGEDPRRIENPLRNQDQLDVR